MGITIHRQPKGQPWPNEEPPLIVGGRLFIREETQWTRKEPVMTEQIEVIYLDKDGKEVPAGSVAAVRQLTHDDAKRWRDEHKARGPAKVEEKAADAVEDKAAAPPANKGRTRKPKAQE